MNIKISPMAQHHIDAVHKIELESFSMPWSRASFEEFLSSPMAKFFVAELEGNICGFAGLYYFDREGDVVNIATALNYRRLGVAKALLRHIEQFARQNGVVTLMLEVRTSNAAARTLYQNMGFSDAAIRKGYYQNPKEDAIVMVKSVRG